MCMITLCDCVLNERMVLSTDFNMHVHSLKVDVIENFRRWFLFILREKWKVVKRSWAEVEHRPGSFRHTM